MTRTAHTFSALGLAAALTIPSAQADTGVYDWGSYGDDSTTTYTDVSEAETSFKGAVMLQAGIDVTFGAVTSGILEDDDNYRYAFFSGNTLYAGVEDIHGNTTDMIVEFFWFESSIERGSDFWVAVVKARTTPNLEEGWKLMVEDEPVLSLHAETFNDMGNSGFRWDWSLPFESYGWDAYGSVTMESAYGLNTNAEGASMVAFEYKNKEDAAGGSVTEEVATAVQSKGYMNEAFQIQTKYQITLWRWEMMVQGTPSDMDWDLYLDSWDRQEQNAYHEYMLVMQADEGKGFELERIELSGNTTDPRWYWWDNTSTASIAVNDIRITRPDIAFEDLETDQEANDNADNNTGSLDAEGPDASDDPVDVDDSTPSSTTNVNVEVPAAQSGCSTTGNRTAPWGFALALGLVAMGRRRNG